MNQKVNVSIMFQEGAPRCHAWREINPQQAPKKIEIHYEDRNVNPVISLTPISRSMVLRRTIFRGRWKRISLYDFFL